MVPKQAPLAQDRLLTQCQQALCPQRQARTLRTKLQGKQCILLWGHCCRRLQYRLHLFLSDYLTWKTQNILVTSQAHRARNCLPGTDESGDVRAGNFRKRWNYWLLANLERFIWVFTFCNHRRGMQFIKNTLKYMTGGCLLETYMFSKSLYLKDSSFGRYSAYGS